MPLFLGKLQWLVLFVSSAMLLGTLASHVLDQTGLGHVLGLRMAVDVGVGVAFYLACRLGFALFQRPH